VRSVRIFLAAAGLLLLVGAGSPGSGVQTLYRSGSGPITAFAQDGSLVAWFSPGRRSCNAVHVLSLGGVKVTLPKPGTSNVTCRWDVGQAPVRLAVAAGTGGALWTLHEHASIDLDYVVGADVKQPRERRFYQLAHTHAGAGLWLGGIAGDGRTLVYSIVSVGYVNQVACLSGGSCERRIRGGGIHRIVGRSNPLVPGTGPALQVATASGRIAYIHAGTVDENGRPSARPDARVDVRTARDGALVTSLKSRGTPLAIALSPHVLALLERSSRGTRIAWFDALRGNLLGSVPVPSTTSHALGASDQLVVYRVGRVLHAIDLAHGEVRRLVQTETTPIGFSLVGSRLAWAENVNGKGRIRALFVRGRG
jgi:hypothetical protein